MHSTLIGIGFRVALLMVLPKYLLMTASLKEEE
jgi:hypothetical protein